MNKTCECPYCKNGVKELFCITCGHNYNSCESIYEANEVYVCDFPIIGHPLCPKCCHETWNPEVYPGYEIRKVKTYEKV